MVESQQLSLAAVIYLNARARARLASRDFGRAIEAFAARAARVMAGSRPPLVLWLALALGRASAQICGSQQDFSPDTFFTQPLTSGVVANSTLCPNFWAWFTIPTRTAVTYTRLEQQGRNWVDVPVSRTITNGIAVSVDAGYDYVRYRYTTLAVVVVNGTPPVDLGTIEPWTENEYRNTHHIREPYTDRETLTMGYNDTAGSSCQEGLAEYIYIGVQCISPLGADPCSYVVSATQMPNELYHGVDLTARIRPAWPESEGLTPRHYYTMSLGAYDTLQVNVYRVADGRPLHDATNNGLGIGLAAGAYLARGECPTNSSGNLEQRCSLDLNATVDEPCEMGNFCSEDEDAGEYTMMIEADVLATRPVTYVDIYTSPFIGDCEPYGACEFTRNMVGPDGLRPTASIVPSLDDDPPPPRYNEPRRYITAVPNWYPATNTRNELRPDHGTYRLTVRQLEFEEGAMLQDEVRPGCVSYGQWRRFRIAVTRPPEGTLMLHMTTRAGVSGVYVQEGSGPSLTSYDAVATRLAGGDNVHRLAASLCDLRRTAVWHIGVYLGPAAEVRPTGLRHTEFTLSVHLEDATVAAEGGTVVARGGDSSSGVPAQGAAGQGFVCCGVVKYHLVPQVPFYRSLRATLTVTSGNARALYLKHATCPRYPEDVSGQECLGFCIVRWLTVYDPYNGAALSHLSDAATVPNGDNLIGPDIRGEGDWYIGVQALDGQAAEYTLTTELVDTPEYDTGYRCDRFDGPCPSDHWMADEAELSAESTSGAALRGRRAGPTAAHVLALVVASAGTLWVASSRRERL